MPEPTPPLSAAASTVPPSTPGPSGARLLAALSARARLGPVIAAECGALAAGGTAVAVGAPPLATAAAALAAAALCVSRRRGRWAGDVFRVWLRHRVRLRRAAAPEPVVSVDAHVDRSGVTYGVLVDRETLTMVIAVDATRGTPPPHLLARALDDRDVRLAAVHLVTSAGPVRGAARVPWTLVALHLRPADCPGAVLARGGGHEGARRALGAVTGRTARRIVEYGFAVRVLEPEELGDVPRTVPRSGADTEAWTYCLVQGQPQVCFGLDGWPDDPRAFLDELVGSGSPDALLALRLTAGEREVRRRAVLRLAGDPERLRAVLRRPAGRHRVNPIRLDGEHGPGIEFATLGWHR